MADSLLYDNRGSDLRSSSVLSSDRSVSCNTPHRDMTTTTISTIAVKSGETKIIIALLQCGNWIHIKVLELTPDLTLLGGTLDEARKLQIDHDDVLNKLQTKQNPVEELLRQADQLISSQKPKAEIYAAMAENLGLAWKDLNSQLEYRKQILDKNVAFKRRANELSEKMTEAEKTFKSTCLSRDACSIKDDLSCLNEARKSVLTALMLALQEGQGLLDKLKEVENQSFVDSRPNRFQPGLDNAINRVERWIEELHDRRRTLEEQWLKRKKELEQKLAGALLMHDLDELQQWLNIRGHEISQIVELGCSSPDTELLLHEHSKIEAEVKDVQARGIRLMKTAEQLISSGRCTDEQPRSLAFMILDQISDLAAQIERRRTFLKETLQFFRESQLAQTKLCQLEIRLSSADLPGSSNQMAQLHARTAEICDDTALPVIRQGQDLEESVGRGAPGTKGLSDGIQELITAYDRVVSMCQAHKEIEVKKRKELRAYQEGITSVEHWLENVCDAFLQVKHDMGRDLQTAEEFLALQKQMIRDLMVKRNDIEDLSQRLPHLDVGNLNEVESLDRRLKGVSQHWKQLKQTMESRLDISDAYVQFHSIAVDLSQKLDSLEKTLRMSVNISEEELKDIQETWMSCQQEFLQLQVAAKHFSSECEKCVDPHLDLNGAQNCVENILERFGNRQIILTREWQTLETTVSTRKEIYNEWTRLEEDVISLKDKVTKDSEDVYPMIPSALNAPGDIVHALESQMTSTIPNLQKTQAEIELKLKTAEYLSTKGKPDGNENSILSDLTKCHSLLTQRTHDYQSLLGDTIGYFRNIQELQKMVERLRMQNKSLLPEDVTSLESAIKEHEVSNQTGRQMFRIALDDANKLIGRIKLKEPPVPASQDETKVKSIVADLNKEWDDICYEYRQKIDNELKYSHFNMDLRQINLQLQELNDQLKNLKGQYGESLNSAKATSMAFGHFENTITLLEKRITNFVSTAQAMITGHSDPTGHIKIQLESLETKWSTLQRQVGESRKMIDLSIDYFTLVEEAEEWYKSGSKLLITIARKSTSCKDPQDAKNLLEEIDSFLKPGRKSQQERLRKISSLAVQLYGSDDNHQFESVNTQNNEMMESFSTINAEINNLLVNLETARIEKQRQEKEKEEIEADLAAAKADREAARQAALAAEEAMKAAEALSKSITEQSSIAVTTKFEVESTQTDFENEIIVKESIEQSTKETSKSPKLPRKLPEVPPPMAPKFIQGLQDMEVDEGSKVILKCVAKGSPIPEIIWYKDGMSIDTNPDYLTSYDKGLCTLTIEETFVEDSATFTCKAINTGGMAETNAILKVKEGQIQDELLPPEFEKYLEAKTIEEDDVCALEAQVVGNPLPVVSWFKESNCIDHISEYNITYNNGYCALKLNKTSPLHQGLYTVKANNPLGSCQSTARLTVNPKIKINLPEFKMPLSNVMARAGQKLRLECKLKTDPETQVAWLHNGRPIRETRELKLQYDGEKATLIIMEAFPKDAGTYVIIAKNTAGESSSSCNVSVKGRLPAESSDSEVFSDMEPVKPSVQVHLSDITVKEGEKVRMDCVIVGQPEPEVIWYHNDQPVKESSDFQLLFQGDRCSLLIQEAFREDAGKYQIVAINSAGEAKDQCCLTVRSPEDALGPMEEPKFEKLLTDIVCKEGKDVTLECIVSGQPEPNVTWYKDEKQIHPSSDFLFKHEKNGCVSLHIPEIFLQDGGIYTVKANNLAGEAKCYCNMKVEPRSPKEEPVRTKSLPPKFIQLFKDRTVYEGKPVRFDCVISGTPKPKVMWTFNSEKICPLDEKMQGNVTGDKYSLYIPESEKSFNGRISCVAENDAGKATCSALLTVYESSPSQVVESPTLPNGYSSVITNTAAYKESSIIEQDVVTQETVKTHHAASQLNLSTKHIIDKEPEYTQTLKRAELLKDIHDDSFEIHHQTSSLHIQGNKSNEILSKGVYSPSKSTITPRFIIPLPAKVVEEGKRVSMEGTLEGLPQPSVEWFKDDGVLKTNDKLRSFYDGLKVRLEIDSAAMSDSGRYKCVANNLSGTATSIADLIVKEHLSAPLFTIPLQARLCHVGEDVTLEAHVKGAPTPSVTWEKDNRQLKSDGRIEVFVDHTKHVLRIRSATLSDTGSYSIKATNPAGEARCIADLIIDEVIKQSYTIKKMSISKEETCKKDRQDMSDLPSFEPFPNLEPFPYTPDPPKPKGAKLPMVGMPSKFIPKQKSPPHDKTEDTSKIPPVWRPTDSDNEDMPSYKKVQISAIQAQPKGADHKQPLSPDPPSKFDVPPKFDGPPRPKIDFDEFISSNKEERVVPVDAKPVVKTFTQQHILKDSKSIEYTKVLKKTVDDEVTTLPAPGPPPEIGYFSKGSSPIGDPVKGVKAIRNKLEKMQSEESLFLKSPSDIPGAVKLFPSRVFRSQSLEPQGTLKTNKVNDTSVINGSPSLTFSDKELSSETYYSKSDTLSKSFVTRYTNDRDSTFYSEDESNFCTKASTNNQNYSLKGKQTQLINAIPLHKTSPHIFRDTPDGKVPKYYQSLVTDVKEERFKTESESVKTVFECDKKTHTFLTGTQSVLVPTIKAEGSDPGVIEQHLLKPSELVKSRVWPPMAAKSLNEGNSVNIDDKHGDYLLGSGKEALKTVRIQTPDALIDPPKCTPRRKNTPAPILFMSPEMRTALELEDEREMQSIDSQQYAGCTTVLSESSSASTQVFPKNSSIFSDNRGTETVGITSGSMLAPCPVESIEKPIQFINEKTESESQQEEYKVSSVSISKSPLFSKAQVTTGNTARSLGDLISNLSCDTEVIQPTISYEGSSNITSNGQKTPVYPSKIDRSKPISISQMSKISPSIETVKNGFESMSAFSTNRDIPPSSSIPPIHETIRHVEDTSFEESSSLGTRFVTIQKNSNILKFKDTVKLDSELSGLKEDKTRKPVSLATMGQTPGKLVIETTIDIPKNQNVILTHDIQSPEPPERPPPPPCEALTPPAKPKRFYPRLNKTDYDSGQQTNFKPQTFPNIKSGGDISDDPNRSQTPPLEPGPPIEIGYVARPPSKVPDFPVRPHDDYTGKKQTTHTTEVIKTRFDEMNNKFVSEVQKFGTQIAQEVQGPDKSKSVNVPISTPSKIPVPKSTPPREIIKTFTTDDSTSPKAYSEETRAIDFGTKQIDPDTGLIYFKYDFGYEFGIVTPGDSVNGGGKKGKNSNKQSNVTNDTIRTVVPSKSTTETPDIKARDYGKTKNKHFPNFRPKKFSQFKAVKWEPTSESEASDLEHERPSRKRHASMTERPSTDMCWQKAPSSAPSSPWSRRRQMTPKEEAVAFVSAVLRERTPDRTTRISPLRITSPHLDVTSSVKPTTHIPSGYFSGKSPVFCQPLREVAIGTGQPLKLDCIVQGEPLPDIQWYKDGKPISNTPDFQISLRDGICSLVIPEVYKEDSGVYSCTATNALGSVSTTTSILVSGERR